MKIAIIGGVRSTRLVIQKLCQHDFSDVIVFGYEPLNTCNVSGWVDLSISANDAGYVYCGFRRVSECTESLRKFTPVGVFAVGLSQIIPEGMLKIPSDGFVGFHPTKLPLGRGRAPLAWLILEQNDGAASFFVMQNGVDDGPILAQVPFTVDSSDDASSVEEKLLKAEAIALDEFLPRLVDGSIELHPQDHDLATYYGKRSPEDGLINWNHSVVYLLSHIRASCPPHPGAFTYDEDFTIVILRAKYADTKSVKGVIGRILEVTDTGEFLIQCGDGCLLILEWYAPPGWFPRVGRLLGYYPECEISNLRSQVACLQARISELEAIVPKLLSRDY